MELEYKIKTTAELAGAEAAADAIERQIGKTKALQQDSSGLQAQLTTMRASIAEATAAHVASGAEIGKESWLTKKLTLGKFELRESIRGVTRQYPILGEIAQAVFNPMVLSIFGVIEAFNIWNTRVNTLTAALGGVELPDLGEHIIAAKNTAQAYDGIAKAVTGADEAFDSAAAAFERQSKATQAQLTATKALIDAEKQRSLAELDIEKSGGKMSEADYAARKSRIETGASDATVQAEINARNADLQARKDEAARQFAEADKKARAAAAIKLPKSDDVAQAQAQEFRDIAAARKAEADAAQKRKREIEDYAGDREGGLRERLGAFPKAIELATKYGANTEIGDAAKMEEDAERIAREQQRAAEKSAARIEQKIKDRAKLRSEAEKSTADGEKDRRGLAGEDDPNQVGSNAWQNAQARKTQGIKDTTAGLQDVAGQLGRGNKDLALVEDIHGKSSQTSADVARVSASLKDAHDAVAYAAATISQLSAMGAEVANLKIKVAQLRAAVDHH